MRYETPLHFEIKDLISQYLKEQKKIENGNKSAVLRARKALLQISKKIPERRRELQIEKYLNK